MASHVWFEFVFVVALFSITLFRAGDIGNLNPWVGGLLIAGIISFLFSSYDPPSIGLVINKKYIFSPAVFGLFTLLIGVGWYSMVVMTFDDSTIRWALDAFCLVALTNIAFIYSQGFFDYDPINMMKTEPLGLCPNRNATSALLAFCLPAFFRKRWLWFLPLFVPAFVLVKSTGGIIAAMVGVLVYLTVSGYWVYGSIVSLAVIISYTGIVDKIHFGPRLGIWEIGWEEFWKRPWFGAGIGQWKTITHELYSVKHLTPTWHARAHNEYIQGAVEMGVPFLICLVGYGIDILRRLKKHALLSLTAFIIIAVNCIVNFAFHIPVTGIIALTWLGILHVQLREA